MLKYHTLLSSSIRHPVSYSGGLDFDFDSTIGYSDRDFGDFLSPSRKMLGQDRNPLTFTAVELPDTYMHRLFCMVQTYDNRWHDGLYSAENK